MKLRLAQMDDLPQLKAVYGNIIEQMNRNNIQIWDDVYPYEFFQKDIENNRLYILVENGEIISAFALCDSNAGANCVQWKKKHASALYIDRLGVNVNYLKKGIGSKTLNLAIAVAREKGAKYLRLFVVDINEPAIKFYIKNGFEKAEGIYDEIIDDDLFLREFGFEIRTST